MTADDTVIRIRNEPFASNTYLVRASQPGTCVIVDPGLDEVAVERALAAAALVPVAIFVTHGHFDHIGSAEHFRSRFAIPVYCHPADEPIARSSNFRLLALKSSARVTIPAGLADIHDSGALGHVAGLRLLDAPGHTPGGVVVMINGAAFTGDTVYRTGVWPMTWPEQDNEALMATIRHLWTAIPDATIIYPGHGGSATFGSIKSGNAELRELIGLPGVARA